MRVDDVASNISRPYPYAASRGEAGSLPLRHVGGSHVQGLTLLHFSAKFEPFWTHLRMSPSLIDWGKVMHPTYPTKCAYVEPKSGRV
jgi:hypothetical protein